MMNKISRRFAVAAAAILTALALTACSSLNFAFKDFQSNLGNLSATMSTYDAQGEMIDRVDARGFAVTRDTRFDSVDSSGTSQADSGVLHITAGGHEVSHVGSAMIIAEEGLDDAMVEFPEQVDIAANGRSIPFVNRFVDNIRNEWDPKSKVVLIRSQQGHPIAIYSGNEVATASTEIPKSTALLVDGKLLIAYRVDYTIYDTALLK